MRHIKIIAIMIASIATITNIQAARDYNQFFRASFAHAQGDHAQAELWFNKLIANATNASPWPLKNYATFLIDSNQSHKIHPLIGTLDKHFPNDVSVQLTIARALETSGSPLNAYQRIIDLHDKHPSNPQVALLAVQSALGSKKPQLALQILERFVNNHTRQATLSSFFVMKAQLHYTLGQKKEAVNALKECVELSPQHAQAWFFKAQLESETGNHQAAAQSIQTLQSLQAATPNNVMILRTKTENSQENEVTTIQTGRGKMFDTALNLISQKKYEQAAPMLLQYVQENAGDNHARILAIQTLIRTKQTDGAHILIHEAIKKQPNEAAWYSLLKSSLNTPQDLAPAITMLQSIIIDHPIADIPKLFLAELLLETGNIHEGDSILGQLIRTSSNQKVLAAALQVQSVLAMQQGNEQLAVSLLEQAHEKDPRDQKTSLLLLELYKTENAQPKKGLRLADTLLKENPKDIHLQLIKGEFCLACGQLPQAIECLEQLTLLEPANVQAWSLLSQAQLLKGNKKAAFLALKQANRLARSTYALSSSTTESRNMMHHRLTK